MSKSKSGNVQTALGSPTASQTKDQTSKKTNDQSAIQETDDSNSLIIREENIKGQQLSKEEGEAVLKQAQESQKLFSQNANSATSKRTAQDSITKVKSFAKSGNLTSKNIFEVKKEAFGLASSDKMQLKLVSDKHGRTLATYQQLHNSIPVEGAIYKVRENKTKIDAFGEIRKKLPESGNYKINASQGLESALRTVNAKEYVWQSKKMSALVNKNISKKPEGELVYVGPDFSSELKEYHLAWKYDIFATNPQSSQTIYVDANSGKTILKIDLSRDLRAASSVDADGRPAVGKGKARFAGDVTFGTTQYSDGYRLESLVGKYKVPMYTLNMNHAEHASDEVLTEYIDEDNNWNDLYNKDHDEAAIDIHWGMQKTLNYYEEKFDRNSVDDKGMTIFALAHLGTNVQNASWTGGWAQFGDGIDQPFVSLGITGHEMTHAITQFSAGLIYQGESGAMNESFSDIFGISIELYAGKDSKNDIWMLGDELYKHGSLRSMADPKAAGQPDTYGGQYWADPAASGDNGGVHQNSGITNYWYYLLVEGGEGVNDLNNSYKIKGIGLEKAEKIAYLTLTEYLSPSSNFRDMRNASLMATEDLYGLGSEEYKQVTNAWYAIGVGAAYSDKQLSIVSVQNPSLPCGQLKGDEPFYITFENTGIIPIKAYEVLNYKLRAMSSALGRLIVFYSNDGKVYFPKDLAPGEKVTLELRDKIPYQTGGAINYIEVKLDLNPITEFGQKSGYTFTSQIVVPIAQKDFDIKVTNLEIPDYNGGVQSANHTLAISLYNLGCQDIPAGSKLKIGYADTTPGSVTVWKDITLETAFKGKSEIKIPFDGTVDLSGLGLHTYEAYVTYDKDPVTTNNSILNAAYSGIVTQFPYVQGFERTPGGWNTKSLNATNQKFIFQNYPASFRDVKSQYMWGMVDFKTNERPALNSDFVLESPIFDFTNVVSPYAEFDLYYLFHKGYDGLIVEYSEDKGKSWKKVEDVSYPEKLHYNEAFDGGWFTGVNNSLKKDPSQIRLNALAGKKVALRFHVKTDDYNDGFLGGFIDNIRVSDAPYDIEVLAAKLEAGKCTIDNTNASVIAKITNNFATTSQVVNVTTKVLDAAKNVVFSQIEKRTLTFAKFKDTISISVPNINLKTAGEHTITVSVFPEDMLQDLKQANNSYVFAYDNWNNEDMKVSVLPYKMDFEDASKYKGWRTSENKGSAGWKHGVRADLGSPGWFLADHTKFMASNDDKCNCDESNDMLISPVFDLTNYKEAHLSFDGYGDSQHLSDGSVKVSTDGGQTWKEVFHMPYYGAWWEYGVDLTEYAGKSCVQVAFVHNDNGLFASGFAVDNIEIKEKKSNLRPSNLVVAETVYEDAPSHEFNVNVKNSAYNTVDKFTIEYQISQNGTAIGNPISLAETGELLVGQTINYKVNGLPQLAAGKYDIALKAYTATEPKEQALVIKGSFEVIAKAPELSLENFSNVPKGSLFGAKGFVSSQSDENYPWRIVTTADNTYLSVPKKDHTGDTSTTMLYSQLEGLYYYGEVISPMYKLSDKASAVEFYYAMQSNVNDILLVDIKAAGGEWTELWRRNKEGSYGDTDWKRASLNIIKYRGKSVMFRFRHAKADGYSYMVLDDLKIFNEEVTDVAMEILSPKDVCGNDEYKVRLKNEGQIAIKENSIQVNLEYKNTSEKISEAVAAGIPVGESIEYTFKTTPKLVDGDSHVFNFNAIVENDIIAQNNTIEDYTYQGVAGDFKLFDNASVHGYAGKSVYLNAESNLLSKEVDADSFIWNTGETTNAIEVTKPGDYIVTAVLKNGCSITGKVKVTFDTFESELVSGNVCGPEVVLNPGNYKAYEWFDGSTNPTFTATESGDYYVTVYNENGLGKIFNTSITILENKQPSIRVLDDKKIMASDDATAYQWYLNGKPIPNATEKAVATIWEGTYSLRTTNSNGCDRMSVEYDSKGLIIGKLTNAFRVFPNPAVDNVNIFLTDKVDGQTELKIYSMNGNAVWSKTYSSMPSNISVSDLTTGVYILDCTVQGKKYSAKIIKN
ncbi:T9SS type A sorting domain-containing protein [Flavobacterium zhairuonense]|uniref:M4 family metallopeptidase n=1 Tax=Flavobacterium zhairuonense TaxID=2493631 RepID=UPI0013C2F5CA|nr:M4 family metallopeptidase [Flavobacterium zhairuonense]KAF2506932.1 T9SS type A sorting domain-containing protein [Flavobacterium zhairuonense]